MKFAFVSDIHAHAFGDFSKDVQCEWDEDKERYIEQENGSIVLKSRLYNILSGLCDMRDYCILNHIELVVNGGDTFHRRSILDVTTFNCVHKVLFSFYLHKIKQIILSGNHDNASNSDNTQSSIETFSSFAQVLVKPECIPITHGDEHIRLCCLPWTKSKTSSIDFINTCLKSKDATNILVAHLGISGASLGSGYIMSDDYTLSELKADKWKYVLLGHYHHPQVLYENTIYAGSPLQNDFGDYGQHGFWIVDTSRRWDLQLVPLNYPQFLTIPSDSLKNYTEEELEFNYIRIQTTTKNIEEVQKKVEKIGDVRIEVEKEYVKNVRSDISVSMKQEDIIKSYVKENNKELDSKLLIKRGLEIMQKARENL